MTEPPAKSSTTAGDTPAVEAPPLAPDGAPICYVVDEEPSIRHFLSLILHGAGVDTVEFPDGASMRKAIEARPPALVFHQHLARIHRRHRIRGRARQAEAIAAQCS